MSSTNSVRVVERRHDGFSDRSWGARCAACGQWLTKYDWTPEDAHALGTSAMRDHILECPNRIELAQLELA